MYHSTLGSRVIKKKKKSSRESGGACDLRGHELDRVRVIPRQPKVAHLCAEREFFIDNLLVRIHFIIEMIW